MITTRKIDTVFIHCSASDRDSHDSVDVIRSWHLDRGWSDIGYHFVITQNGRIYPGRPLSKMPAAQRGHNRGAIAICLTGKDEFSADQFDTLRSLCNRLWTLHAGVKPLRFRGHCEVSRKTCPVFEYDDVLCLSEGGYLAHPTLEYSQAWERWG